MTKEKLIAQYKEEIKSYDLDIKVCTNMISETRKNKDGFNMFTVDQLHSDRAIYNAQKQRTVQFISDLEDLD